MKSFLKKIRAVSRKMDLQNEKCVMVIDENLPLGIIANTAAIMGITLGKKCRKLLVLMFTTEPGMNI